MIKITKEQIKETLERLQDYSHWMFYGEGSKNLENKITTYKNRNFSLKVREDGKILAKLDNGVIGVFDVNITTTSLQNGLDNLKYETKFMNYEDIYLKEDLEYLNELRVFIMSYFQRLNAFTFFCRMAPETIEGISNDLSMVKEN